MILYNHTIIDAETIISLDKKPNLEILEKISFFLNERNGYYIDEMNFKKFLIPRKIKEKHLQILFDSLNIPLLNKNINPNLNINSSIIKIKNENNTEKEKIDIENIYIPFGKYKGMKYIHIEDNYLKWIIDNFHVKKIKEYAQLALERKNKIYI